VAFRCPYCDFRIAVKSPPKPGRYTPGCPRCKAKISLTVTSDAEGEWLTAKIAGQTPVIPPEPEATSSGIAASPSVGEETEATGNFRRTPEAADQTAVHTDSPADQTAAFGVSSKTKTGSDDTMAHTSGGEPPEKKPNKQKKSKHTEVDVPESLGGYEVVKELGRGGMGAVYLARQVSLDRPVALKVMKSKWASDPVFLARFTREAFAAAQLVHHNVVQIYDIGEQHGINYFSMEFVEGKSLGDIVKSDGKVKAEDAIGFILQAARGLKFAHDRGMIHRDVKPDNLMLNVHGIVKVADLGLVKTPSMTAEDDAFPLRSGTDPDIRSSMSGLRSLPSDITLAHTAMGSPAYMSPEQCKDAASVDPRADIYSLGCTMYALLAGRPPFQGANVYDIMAKHATEPVEPVAGVSKEVNACLAKSLAKKPDDRQQTMEELVADLERLLPSKGGTHGTMEEHLSALEENVRKFNAAPLAKVRKTLIPAFYLGSLLAALIGLFAGGGLVSAAIVALVIETTLAYFVLDGIFRKSYVFRRVREWAFGARIGDWAMGVLGLVMLLLVLWLVGLLWVWLGTALVAVGIAFAFHFVIDRRLSAQRHAAVEAVEKMLKRLRMGGMDEEAVRLFVAKNADRNWEEFYEALFGFESKLSVRPTVEEQAGAKLPRFGGWREPLVARLDRAQQWRREAKTRKMLQKVESKKLRSEGVDRREAEAQAEAAAESMVERAAEIKAAKHKPVNVKAMMSIAEKPVKRLPKPPGYHLWKTIDRVLSWKLRFVVGALLIGVGALWVREQVDPEKLSKAVDNVTAAETDDSSKAAAKQAAGTLSGLLARSQPPTVRVIGTLPKGIDCLNPLLAGLIVLASVVNRRGLGISIQLLGAGVAMLGHLFDVIPTVGPIEPHHLTMLVGLALAVLGAVIGRK
jgi:serine/threonine protein kinase